MGVIGLHIVPYIVDVPYIVELRRGVLLPIYQSDEWGKPLERLVCGI